jgi:hypothetical protein
VTFVASFVIFVTFVAKLRDLTFVASFVPFVTFVAGLCALRGRQRPAVGAAGRANLDS